MSFIGSSSRHFSDVRLKFGRAELNMKLFQFWLKVSFPRPLGTLRSLPKTSGTSSTILLSACICCCVFLLHVSIQVAGALLLQPAARSMTQLTARWDGRGGAGWMEGSVHGERFCVSFLSYFFSALLLARNLALFCFYVPKTSNVFKLRKRTIVKTRLVRSATS